jgi:hypothetical protein
MGKSDLLSLTLATILLGGCTSPKKPEISTIDASLPFNKAMEAVIRKDEFLTVNLRPGFHRSADGTMESYTLSPDKDGSATVEHLALLAKKWCTQNGGHVKTYSEVPVLQRGDGNVLQQRQNLPVIGNAYNMVCYKGKEALAGAAIGRTNYFMNSSQFEKARNEAGASIVEMNRAR